MNPQCPPYFLLLSDEGVVCSKVYYGVGALKDSSHCGHDTIPQFMACSTGHEKVVTFCVVAA
eukprot:10909724-Ditylum_brightwellii.AAC.1